MVDARDADRDPISAKPSASQRARASGNIYLVISIEADASSISSSRSRHPIKAYPKLYTGNRPTRDRKGPHHLAATVIPGPELCVPPCHIKTGGHTRAASKTVARYSQIRWNEERSMRKLRNRWKLSAGVHSFIRSIRCIGRALSRGERLVE